MRLKLWLYPLIGILALAILSLPSVAPLLSSPFPASPTPVWRPPPAGNQGQLLFVTTDLPGQTIRSLATETDGTIRDTASPVVAGVEGFIPPGYAITALSGSPNGRWVSIQMDSEASAHTLILDLSTAQVRPAEPEPGQNSIFLGWTPDGNSLILRVDPVWSDQIVVVNLLNGTAERLDTPPSTWDAAISPSGEHILAAVTRGRWKGGELWLMNRDDTPKQLLVQEPKHFITYPRWSPYGDRFAYILMPDTDVRFSVGQLWLADAHHPENRRMVAEADAGHGFPPVWSPDGKTVAFVVRENPDNPEADISGQALESNIYLLDGQTGAVRQLTHFQGTRVDRIAWSPNGTLLAFRTIVGGISDIWVADVFTGEMRPIIQGLNADFPIWLPASQKGVEQ